MSSIEGNSGIDCYTPVRQETLSIVKDQQAELGSSDEAEQAIIGRCFDCGFAKRVVEAAVDFVSEHPGSTLAQLAEGRVIVPRFGSYWEITHIPDTALPNSREHVLKHIEFYGTPPQGVGAEKRQGVVGSEFQEVDEEVSRKAKVLQELVAKVEDCNGCEGRTCDALVTAFLKEKLSGL